jgi:FkbM family methyltransferase
MIAPFAEFLTGASGQRWLAFKHDQYITPSLKQLGRYSPAEVDLLKQWLRPHHGVVVIGANIGGVALPLAKHVYPGATTCFEPQRLVAQMLAGNALLHQLETVFVVQGGVGDDNYMTQFPAWDPRAPQNTGGIEMGMGSERAMIRKLDDLNIHPFALLHIDAEGMEPDVLAGAEKTIAKYAPIIYAEVDRLISRGETLGRLIDLGYRRVWLHQPPLLGKLISINVLALPPELPDPVDDGYLERVL